MECWPICKSVAKAVGMRYSHDLRTLLFCVLYFGMIAFRWTHTFEGWWTNFFLFWATGMLSFQGAVTVHNAVHCPVFKSKAANSAFQVVLSLWFGHTASSYVPGHNLSHHRNLQTRKDVMRTTKMRYRWHFLNGLLFVPTTLASTSSNDESYFNAQRALQRPIYTQLQLEAAVYVAVQLVFVLSDPRRWLLVFWLPHLVSKYSIISLNMLQHDGCDERSKYNHSRNFVGWWLNFLCFNNGYHGIHHMYPGKHWSCLKEEHEKRVKHGMHPALDEPSIFGFIFCSFIYPGIRKSFDGKPMAVPEDQGPDEPWFYSTTESYSDRDVDRSIWAKHLNQFGPDSKPIGGIMSKRDSPTYVHMSDESAGKKVD